MRFPKFAAAMAAISLTGPAMAQDLVSVGQVGVWEIFQDPTVGNGCLINAVFEDGSDVRIGFDAVTGGGYLLALNEAWQGIEEGATYPITLDVDGATYNGEAVGIMIDGMPGADIPFDSIDFLMDVATKHTLTLINDNGPVMAIDLTDSLAAIEAAIACQEESSGG
jgi:hypothetical protein